LRVTNPKAAKKQIVQYVFLSLFIVFQNEIIMMVTQNNSAVSVETTPV
jgi:hypothetical protein